MRSEPGYSMFPLPGEEVPKTFLEVNCSTGSEEQAFPMLCEDTEVPN
jgi:hypothetical protein